MTTSSPNNHQVLPLGLVLLFLVFFLPWNVLKQHHVPVTCHKSGWLTLMLNRSLTTACLELNSAQAFSTLTGSHKALEHILTWRTWPALLERTQLPHAWVTTELTCSTETRQIKPRVLQDLYEVGSHVLAKGEAHRFQCHSKEIIAVKERHVLGSAERVFLHAVCNWYLIQTWGNGSQSSSLETPKDFRAILLRALC